MAGISQLDDSIKKQDCRKLKLLLGYDFKLSFILTCGDAGRVHCKRTNLIINKSVEMTLKLFLSFKSF